MLTAATIESNNNLSNNLSNSHYLPPSFNLPVPPDLPVPSTPSSAALALRVGQLARSGGRREQVEPDRLFGAGAPGGGPCEYGLGHRGG